MSTKNTSAHFLEVSSGKMIAKRYIEHIPRVGDECRFKEDAYWKVDCVVHCYDEGVPVSRVNIGLVKVEEKS